MSINQVRLSGRLAADPVERVLPSGDHQVTFRIVVDRPASSKGPRIDSLECVVWDEAVRGDVLGLAAGTVVTIEGTLRRRFYRLGGAALSRTEVEVETLLEGEQVRHVLVWTATVATPDSRYTYTTVYGSEADCHAAIRENHDPENECKNDTIEELAAYFNLDLTIDSHVVAL